MAMRWILVVLLLAGCGGATTPGGGRTVDVELDIYSGRPNPTWALSPQDADTFDSKLAALPAAQPSTLVNPLGYRGFIVHARRGDDEARSTVQQGQVQSTQGGTTTFRSDPDRALERWLLDTGRATLSPDVVQAVENALR